MDRCTLPLEGIAGKWQVRTDTQSLLVDQDEMGGSLSGTDAPSELWWCFPGPNITNTDTKMRLTMIYRH
jgi:hypothetical protein